MSLLTFTVLLTTPLPSVNTGPSIYNTGIHKNTELEYRQNIYIQYNNIITLEPPTPDTSEKWTYTIIRTLLLVSNAFIVVPILNKPLKYRPSLFCNLDANVGPKSNFLYRISTI